jgi:hypothetical protein
MISPGITRYGLVIAIGLVLGAQPAPGQWADWPPGPRDSDLEAMVRSAYGAAATHARSNDNYFARDEDFGPLRQAIVAELVRDGHANVEVAAGPVADVDAVRTCTSSGTALRFSVNMFGDGISLAATTPKRVFSYHYEPHESPAISVRAAGDCAK